MVQVTASREWDDTARVRHVLEYVWRCCQAAGGGLAPEPLVVRHGASRGGDTIAHNWTVQMHDAGYPIKPDAMPAEWRRYGKAAGLLRNTTMIVKGDIDVCLAFSRNNSDGTADCMAKAREAGIPVWFHPYGLPSGPPPPARLLLPELWPGDPQ